jgi:hypothetical protein
MYLDQYHATENPEFKGRVIACVRKVAVFVLNESTGTPAYQRRRNLAEAIIANPLEPKIIDAFMWECATNGTIESTIQPDGTATAPDSDFEYVVNVVWDNIVNLQKW